MSFRVSLLLLGGALLLGIWMACLNRAPGSGAIRVITAEEVRKLQKELDEWQRQHDQEHSK
jgi:hypothetical protein